MNEPKSRDIVASAYKSYAASTGNKNFRGDPMPAFDDLPEPIKVAWECAVRQVVNITRRWDVGFEELPDESLWNGWKPPQGEE